MKKNFEEFSRKFKIKKNRYKIEILQKLSNSDNTSKNA